MIKRIISAVVAGAMWLACIMPCLTGCSAGQDDGYTVAQWLDKVETDFNMLYYTASDPYFSNVTSENEDFDTVQIAAEWGLVDTAQGIKLADKVTKEYAAQTLVAAMAFDYEVDAGISDADKVSDLHSASIAVNEGVFSLDSNGRFDPQRKLTKVEADEAASIARDKWVNLTYDESYNKSEVKDGVINLGGLSSDLAEVAPAQYTIEYSGDLNVIDEDGNLVDNSTKTITFPSGTNIGVEVGSVLTLPADSQTPTAFAVVVDSITENSDGSMTVATHNAELEEVYENVDIQISGDDFSLENAVVYDMDGNRLSGGVESDNVSYADGSLIVSGDNEYKQEYLVSTIKNSGKIKITDKVTVGYSVGDKEVSFSIDSKIGKNTKVSFADTLSFGVDSKLKWHLDWFRFKIDEARFVLNTDEKFEGGIKYSKNGSVSGVDAWKDETTGGIQSIIGGKDLAAYYKSTAAQIAEISKELGSAAKELSAPLFKFVVPVSGINVEIIVRLGVTVEGEIKFTADISGKHGAEYVKNKLRTIDESEFEKSVDLDGKVEIRLYLGLGASIFGITAVDLGVNFGVGGKINTKLYQIDEASESVIQECALPTGKFSGNLEEDPELNVELDGDMRCCFDAVAYPIVELQVCSTNSFIGKLVGGIDVTLKGEDDAFFEYHWESDKGKVSECTRECGETYGIEEGTDITFNLNCVSDTGEGVLNIAVGEEYEKLAVKTLPKGYAANDLVFSVENKEIATVENLVGDKSNKTKKKTYSVRFGSASALGLEGSVEVDYNQCFYKKYSDDAKKQMRITGIADGTTVLTASTKDGLYSAQCTIMVGNGGIKERTINAFVIDTYSVNLTPGASRQIVVSSAPEGYDMSQITFTSGDTSVATVSASGTVTGVGTGQTTITISTTDGKYTAMCMVFVSDAGEST